MIWLLLVKRPMAFVQFACVDGGGVGFFFFWQNIRALVYLALCMQYGSVRFSLRGGLVSETRAGVAAAAVGRFCTDQRQSPRVSTPSVSEGRCFLPHVGICGFPRFAN